MKDQLNQFIASHRRLFVLTGAGISTASGIPDYRDSSGAWKHQKPMDYRDFVASHAARQRYWSRSYFGWQRFSQASPNAAHQAIAGLEQLGRLVGTVTQNVDGLHQRAGSQQVTELHGSLATVSCLACGHSMARATMQQALLGRNPQLVAAAGELAPDGDARLRSFDESGLDIPGCESCGGVVKPAVVFFGEGVPPERVQHCRDLLASCDAVLVVGSSLMVYSGFRFIREAAERGVPIAAINRGKTRADELLTHKFELDCTQALAMALQHLGTDPAGSSALTDPM
ncbi:MAG TPA: NAD-dependent protein deacetylase [Gammaproteobacteria bacterium]|nr:NAD-dependent protein deacetylase [Gammaproteobacteria bacterium]